MTQTLHMGRHGARNKLKWSEINSTIHSQPCSRRLHDLNIQPTEQIGKIFQDLDNGKTIIVHKMPHYSLPLMTDCHKEKSEPEPYTQ